ncbi:MAG TPA: nuclear transport factor 2 family protein [Spirochaetia bacterium]|nr:nuclear transport factor 2 family protein [Spirochaetia bacterium]
MKLTLRFLLSMCAAALLLGVASCAPKAVPTDPASVVRAVFEAINQGHGETAASFFAPDAQWITAIGQPSGSQKILSWIRDGWIPLKTRLEIKEIQASGDNVTGVFTVQNVSDEFHSPTPLALSAVVQNGKITSMTWTTKK